MSFECAAPTTGEKLLLKGISSYSAAAACAKLSAAKRAVGEGGTFEWDPRTSSSGTSSARSSASGIPNSA